MLESNSLIMLQEKIRISLMYWFFFHSLPHSPTYSVSFALLVPQLADPTDCSSNWDPLPSGFCLGSTNGKQQQEHMCGVFLPCCVPAWYQVSRCSCLPLCLELSLSSNHTAFPLASSDWECQCFLLFLVSECVPFFVSLILTTWLMDLS